MKTLKQTTPHIKAIVIIGYSNDPVLTHPAEFRFSAIIQKPFKVQDLINTIESVRKS